MKNITRPKSSQDNARDLYADAYLWKLTLQPRQYGTGCAPSIRSGVSKLTWSNYVAAKRKE